MLHHNPVWTSPASPLILMDNDVHVWRASLSALAAQAAELSTMLSPDEIFRAERLRDPQHRQFFIAGRAALRVILSRYLQQPPDAIVFEYGAFGKPTLACHSGQDALSFNVSHSHEIALYAVTRRRTVGIDIEYIRPGIAFRQIARQFFLPAEYDHLCTLSGSDQVQAFFTYWARKEAYSKAQGVGLSTIREQASVLLDCAPTHAFVPIHGSMHDDPWLLHDLRPARGYQAALVVEGYTCQLACYQWPPADAMR